MPPRSGGWRGSLEDKLCPDANVKPETINLRGRFTYEEIATLLKISPMRVRQIEQRALAKLRKALEKRGYTSIDV
jgi:transcriptional regulator